MTFKVSLTLRVNPDVIVSFFVTPNLLDYPDLGTNAITLLTEKLPSHVLLSALQATIPERSRDEVTQLVNLIQVEKDPSV